MKRSLAIVGMGLAIIIASPAAQGGSKRVIVDKTNQELRAYDSGYLVFRTNISTGKRGKETPNGHFHAQGKSLLHYSTLYENAPMPYSVQVNSNYFIHGFSEVPSWPASHGCIRLPVDSAREFYYWVKPGTRIDIVGHWTGGYGPPAVAERSDRRSFFQRLFGLGKPTIRRAEPASDDDWRGAQFEPANYPTYR